MKILILSLQPRLQESQNVRQCNARPVATTKDKRRLCLVHDSTNRGGESAPNTEKGNEAHPKSMEASVRPSHLSSRVIQHESKVPLPNEQKTGVKENKVESEDRSRLRMPVPQREGP
jgi:hypothetical protein